MRSIRTFVVSHAWLIGLGTIGLIACSASDADPLHSGALDSGSRIDAAVDLEGENEDAGEEDVDVVEEEVDAGEARDAARVEQADAAVAPTVGCTLAPGAVAIEHSGNVTSDQSWGAGLHLVRFQTSVRAGATLSIAPCAVVRVRAGQGIDIWEGGTIVAEGSAEQPIRFEPERAGETWSVFQVFAGAMLRLAHVTITGAGNTNDSSAGALSLRGNLMQPTARVQHVTIVGAPRFGVRLDSAASFTPDSVDLRVMGAGEYAVIAHPGSLGSLPSGTYTGNAHDEILTLGGDIQLDMTLRDLGVPYHVGRAGNGSASLRVAANRALTPLLVPLLTIEPGVVLRFEPSASMEIDHFTGTTPATGALRALGTAARPVLFTSAATAPAAGDWMGIWFGMVPDPRNLIDHARIEYAGGDASALNHSCFNPAAPPTLWNSSRGAVLILGPPLAPFITNTTVAHSASNGILRGWRGGVLDFLASNRFEDVAWCLQSFPKTDLGACPPDLEVPCPR